MEMRTLHDLVAHVCDAADVSDRRADVRRAIRSAVWGFQQATTRHQWGAYDTEFTAYFNAPDSDGTIDIDADGVVSRVTYTWPTWAELGSILIDEKIYRVSSRDSDSDLTLETWTGQAVTSQSFELRHDRVVIPDDVREIYDVREVDDQRIISLVDAKEFRRYDRSWTTAGVEPCVATFRAVNDFGTQKVEMRVSPGPAEATELDVAYMRRPRRPCVLIEATGSISSGTITLNKSLPDGTDLSKAVIRVAEDSDSFATADAEFGIQSINWAASEVEVATLSADRTEITTSPALADADPVKLVITDSLDMPPFLHNAAMLYAESQMNRIGSRDLRAFTMLQQQADEELRYAMEQDNRYEPTGGGGRIQFDSLFPVRTLYVSES